jgi:nicotinamidase-related amidase
MEPDDRGALTMGQSSHAAVLVIDVLNDFLEGPFAAPSARRLTGAVQTVIDRARARGVPVIFVCDAHTPDDPEFAVLPPHAIAGTHGAEIVDGLAPGPGEAIIKKRRYSGFFETELADLLRDLRVETIALCGLQTDCCVMHTAADGFFRGFRPVILEDAATARTEDGHRHALASMQRLYGAQVLTSDKFFIE